MESMRTQVAVVAWVNIVLGVLNAVAGGMIALGITAAGFAFLPALPFAAGLGVLIFLAAASGVILGIGLLNYAPWARMLGIVLSILHLIQVHTLGFSTLFGIYSLYVLFHPDTVRLFEGRRNF